MDRDPGLHQLHLLAWEGAVEHVSIRDAQNRLGLIVANMNVRAVVAVGVKLVYLLQR